MKCPNCEYSVQLHFCPNCGEAVDFHHINRKFILHDLQHGILHFNVGFLHTIKQLFIQPGIVAKDFIKGKRKSYTGPFTLLFFISTIYTVLSLKFIVKNVDHKYNFEKYLGEFINHSNWFNLITVTLFAAITCLIFKKSRYNYYEVLVFESFVLSKISVIHILLLPLKYFFSGSLVVLILQFTISLLINIRAKVLFFDYLPTSQVLIKAFIAILLNLVAVFLLILVAAIVFFVLNTFFNLYL